MRTKIEVKKKSAFDISALSMKLGRRAVMVGIPSDSAQRPDGAEITNAQLGYIHEFGAPASGIPARPFLQKGVKRVKSEITKFLENSAKAEINGNLATAEALLARAGITASSSVKNTIVEGNFIPLKPKTIANRYKGRATLSQRLEEVNQDASAVKPLINTGSLLKSITFMVK